ncbi:MAG: DoxX family protein [Stellaceae bacterium]
MEELRMLGRVLLALYMVVGVWNNITGFGDTVGLMKVIGLPLPRVLLPIVILYEAASVVCLFIPSVAIYSALVLAVWCVVVPSLAHTWWKMPAGKMPVGEMRFLNKNLWFANLAIAGGYLLLAFTPM